MNKKNIILIALLLGYLTCNTGIYLFLKMLEIEQTNWIDIEISRHFLVLITIITVYSSGRVLFNKSNFNHLENDILLKILYKTGLIASLFIYLLLDMLIARVIEPLTAIVSFAFVAILFILFSIYIRNKFD